MDIKMVYFNKNKSLFHHALRHDEKEVRPINPFW